MVIAARGTSLQQLRNQRGAMESVFQTKQKGKKLAEYPFENRLELVTMIKTMKNMMLHVKIFDSSWVLSSSIFLIILFYF